MTDPAPIPRHVTLRPQPKVLGYYLLPVFLMVAGWTFVHYVDQPYNSPSYRRTVVQCLGYAAWTTPVEGAGPLAPFVLWALLPAGDLVQWTLPLFGGTVYLSLALLLSRLGRRWDPLAHAMIGAGWLIVGAWILTALTRK